MGRWNVNSRERVRLALNHKEPDRVPFDLGGTVVTGIHYKAYTNLRDFLGLPVEQLILDHQYQQLAKVSQDLIDYLGVDVRNLSAHLAPEIPQNPILSEDGKYHQFYDAFGVGWQMPASGGLYFDMFDHPLSGEIDEAAVSSYRLPDPKDRKRFSGLRESAFKIIHEEKRALSVGNMCSGIFELYMYTRGYQDGYLGWAADQSLAQKLLRRFVDLQLDYWDTMFDTLEGIEIDVVEMSDDLAGQSRLLISPESYRKDLKPLHKEMFDFIHARSDARIFFHSCGNIRQLIPDLIEIGVDILNPVQVNARDMDSSDLKKEFGKDLVFWGGGVDTQGAFDERFSPEDVREDVKKRLDDLMPGGGFIFNPVHNIQANVPPENIISMWETLQEYGIY